MTGPERIVHFAFTDKAVRTGKAPYCGRGIYTDDMGKVNCAACNARILEIVQEWVDDLPADMEPTEADGQTP